VAATDKLRIPPLALERAQGDAAKALSSPTGHMALFGLLAHAETSVLPIMRMGRAILGKQKLPGALRELSILVAMRLAGGSYEWPQHVEIAKLEGLSLEEIAAVERLDLAFDHDPAKRAVAELTRQSVEQVRVSDEAFAAAAAHLDHRELVELLIAIGYYLMLARITEAAGLGADKVEGAAVANAARS
jgi:alkylhydroperoxidase family enzyme